MGSSLPCDWRSKSEIDFSSTAQFLNDLVIVEKLVVSANDINRIYEIDPSAGTFEELPTRPTLQGPNGLSYRRIKHPLRSDFSWEPAGYLYSIDMSKSSDGSTAPPR